LFGGAALNALHVLNEVLQSVRAENGRLPDPLRQGIAEPTGEERAAWDELVPGEEMLAEAGASAADPRAAEEFYLRTTAEPALDRRPLLGRSGGTLPIVPALVDKGIPTIVTGFATSESNIHSPNERLLAEYLPLGIETAKELFRSFSTL